MVDWFNTNIALIVGVVFFVVLIQVRRHVYTACRNKLLVSGTI